MSNITGNENEYKFVEYLNEKKIKDLNPLLKEFIKELFPLENENSLITSWKNHYKQKADIFVKINDNIKGISIKKGIKNSIHVESISEFIHFLIENKIEKEIIIEYLKYHYADGTTNGTGKTRISIEEYKKENQKNIDKINNAFNNEELIIKIIERFITKGRNSKYPVSAIIHGEVNDFIWITTKDIEKIILAKKDIYSTAVHFGPITCQPKNRCLNYNPLYEKDRFCLQAKWYNLSDDIIENMNNKLLNK